MYAWDDTRRSEVFKVSVEASFRNLAAVYAASNKLHFRCLNTKSPGLFCMRQGDKKKKTSFLTSGWRLSQGNIELFLSAYTQHENRVRHAVQQRPQQSPVAAKSWNECFFLNIFFSAIFQSTLLCYKKLSFFLSSFHGLARSDSLANELPDRSHSRLDGKSVKNTRMSRNLSWYMICKLANSEFFKPHL